jgi:hypothetical protein
MTRIGPSYNATVMTKVQRTRWLVSIHEHVRQFRAFQGFSKFGPTEAVNQVQMPIHCRTGISRFCRPILRLLCVIVSEHILLQWVYCCVSGSHHVRALTLLHPHCSNIVEDTLQLALQRLSSLFGGYLATAVTVWCCLATHHF